MELKGAEYVRVRLLSISKHAHNRKDKKIDAARKHAQELSKYSSIEEAHEDFGWGFISEDEYEAIVDMFEGGHTKSSQTDVDDIIISWISQFIDMLDAAIQEHKYELMTPDEQQTYWNHMKELEQLKNKHRSSNE